MSNSVRCCCFEFINYFMLVVSDLGFNNRVLRCYRRSRGVVVLDLLNLCQTENLKILFTISLAKGCDSSIGGGVADHCASMSRV
jgi:hypothetical protein